MATCRLARPLLLLLLFSTLAQSSIDVTSIESPMTSKPAQIEPDDFISENRSPTSPLGITPDMSLFTSTNRQEFANIMFASIEEKTSTPLYFENKFERSTNTNPTESTETPTTMESSETPTASTITTTTTLPPTTTTTTTLPPTTTTTTTLPPTTTGQTGTTIETTTVDPCSDFIPGPVRNITAEFLQGSTIFFSNHSVLYKWQSPQDACLILYYKILIGNMSETEYFESDFLTLLVENQPSCQQNIITVVAVGQGGDGPSVTQSLTIGPGLPGPVNISSWETSNTTINVSFTLPNTNPSCVESYEVTYKAVQPRFGERDVEYTEPYDRTKMISGLEPCVKYEVTVRPLWNNNTFPLSYTKFIRTDIDVPGRPENLIIDDVSEHNMTAVWEPPASNQYCVYKYEVKILDEDGEEIIKLNISETQFEVNNLSSCSFYVFIVKSIGIQSYEQNNKIIDVSEVSTSFNTSEEAPLAPIKGNILNSSSRWANLEWTVPDGTTELNGCPAETMEVLCTHNVTGHNSTAQVTVSSSTLSVNVTDLKPYSFYICKAKLVNEGISNDSELLIVETEQEVPLSPTRVRMSRIYTENFTVEWEPPEEEVALIIEYNIYVRCVQIDTECDTESRCREPFEIYVFNDTELQEMQMLINATAFTEYFVQVAAVAEVGVGMPSENVNDTTLPKESGPVRNIQVETGRDEANDTLTYAEILWTEPCVIYGFLQYYNVFLVGEKPEYGKIIINQNVNDKNITISQLPLDYNFTVEIRTYVEDVTSSGEAGFSTFFTPAGIPPPLEEGIHLTIDPDPYATSNPSSQVRITILRDLFSDKYGTIVSWAVLVAKDSQIADPDFGFLYDGEIPEMKNWRETNRGLQAMYQATPNDWNPFAERNTTFAENITFVVGAENNCGRPNAGFCNGPLHSGINYGLMIRGFTADGYRDTASVFFYVPDVSSPVAIIVSSVLVALTISLIGALFIIRRRKPEWSRKLINTVFGDISEKQPVRAKFPTAMLAESFPVHYDALERVTGPSGDTKLNEEFQLLGKMSPAPPAAQPSSYSIAMLQENRPKNRYVNILPYDDTRVKISITDDDPYSEYINASLITGYSGKVEYIASQGPKADTCEDFWRMIYEHDVSVIVMVTQLVEKGKEKCYQYYPNPRETLDFGYISVKCVTEINFTGYTSRNLLIQKDSLQKSVVHLQFKEWPDFGCPQTTNLMLNFCQTMRYQATLNQGLVLVHCSAGVGRTGTLIAVDILLQHVQENKQLDVYGTVLKLRQQRINMVQTEGQYNYIHQCIKDALEDPTLFNSGLSSITESSEPIYENISSLLQTELDAFPITSDETKVFSNESCM